MEWLSIQNYKSAHNFKTVKDPRIWLVEFLNLNITDIWVEESFAVGLCVYGYPLHFRMLTASLAYTRYL